RPAIESICAPTLAAGLRFACSRLAEPMAAAHAPELLCRQPAPASLFRRSKFRAARWAGICQLLRSDNVNCMKFESRLTLSSAAVVGACGRLEITDAAIIAIGK